MNHDVAVAVAVVAVVAAAGAVVALETMTVGVKLNCTNGSASDKKKRNYQMKMGTERVNKKGRSEKMNSLQRNQRAGKPEADTRPQPAASWQQLRRTASQP